MKRARLASCRAMAWAAVAGLGLLSGCQSMDPCGCRPGLLSRFGCCSRSAGAIYSGPSAPPMAEPMTNGMPFVGEPPMMGPGCCDGGAPSAVPGESLYSGPILGGDDFHGPALPPWGQMGAPNGLPPNGLPSNGLPSNGLPPNGLPPGSGGPFPGSPPSTLPAPMPEANGQLPLTPVPNGNGLAQPTPANPSARRRW